MTLKIKTFHKSFHDNKWANRILCDDKELNSATGSSIANISAANISLCENKKLIQTDLKKENLATK